MSHPVLTKTLPARSARAFKYPQTIRWVGLAALAALALAPLIFDPGARDDSYFAPKWAWIAIWTAVGVAAVAARACAGRPATFPLNEVWVGALCFALWHWVAVLWAPSRSLGIERAAQITWLTLALWVGAQLNLRRRALAWMAWIFVGLAVATAVWALVQDAMYGWAPPVRIYPGAQAAGLALFAWMAVRIDWRRRAQRKVFIITAAALLILFESALWFWVPANLAIQPNLPDWRGFVVAGLGSTSHIGDFLGLALMPALALFGEARNRRARIALFIAAILIPAGLIVSWSVGSDFGLIAGAGLMAALVIFRDRGRWFIRRKWRWIALGIAWCALVAFMLLPSPANPHRKGIYAEAFASDRWHEGWPTREVIWAETLDIIRQHPFRGAGTGNFTYVYPEMDTRLIWNRPDLLEYQGIYTNAAHNELLQAWAELGIAGLFFFLALFGLAFYSLLKGLRWSDGASYLMRVTLAGLLLGWIVQAQMNFSLQQPTGALSFYAILLAVAIEKRTRPGFPEFPSLAMQSGPFMLRMDVQSMTKPTALGVALMLPRAIAVGLGVAVLIVAVAWAPLRWRPVLAQREYQRGVQCEMAGLAAGAEEHFKTALKLDPQITNVRSHYSEWLIKQRRPQEALEQLKIVRERLNSNELWDREARALDALGRTDEAKKARETMRKRVWRAR